MHNYSYLRPPTHALRSGSFAQSGRNAPKFTLPSKSSLSQTQIQSLRCLSEYLSQKYSKNSFPESLLLRYCHLGQYSTTKTLEYFKYYEEWQAMPQIQKNKQRGILHSGVFYAYGRDWNYLPNIYVQPSKVLIGDAKNGKGYDIQDYLVSLRTLLRPIEENMLVEGKIQQWNVIIDARTLGDPMILTSSRVIPTLTKIMNSYPLRLNKLFLIPPQSLLSKFGLSSPRSSPSSKSLQLLISKLGLDNYLIKIQSTTMRQFDPYIPKEEREKQFGGTLEDLVQYWPIVSTNRLMQVKQGFIDGSELIDGDSQDYQSVQNQGNLSFFGEKEEKKTTCRCSIQ